MVGENSLSNNVSEGKWVHEESGDSEDSSNNSQKGKKWGKHEANWKRNVRKRKRCAGKSYVNTANKVVPPRSIGSDCVCKRKCFQNVGEENRKKIFELFYKLSCKDAQDSYLAGLLKVRKVDRHRKRKPGGKEKEVTYQYMVREGVMEYIVCKKAFCAFHGISRSRIERIATHIVNHNTPLSDRRGKHNNRPNRVSDGPLHQIGSDILWNVATNNLEPLPGPSQQEHDPEIAAQCVSVEMDQHDEELVEESVAIPTPSRCIPKQCDPHLQKAGQRKQKEQLEDIVNFTCVIRDKEDLEKILLHFKQLKLVMEVEKLSEERERIAVEKRNIALRSDIFALRRKLSECEGTSQFISAATSLNRTNSKWSSVSCAEYAQTTQSIRSKAPTISLTSVRGSSVPQQSIVKQFPGVQDPRALREPHADIPKPMEQRNKDMVESVGDCNSLLMTKKNPSKCIAMPHLDRVLPKHAIMPEPVHHQAPLSKCVSLLSVPASDSGSLVTEPSGHAVVSKDTSGHILSPKAEILQCEPKNLNKKSSIVTQFINKMCLNAGEAAGQVEDEHPVCSRKRKLSKTP